MSAFTHPRTRSAVLRAAIPTSDRPRTVSPVPAGAEPDLILQAKGLRKRYGTDEHAVNALLGVTLSVYQGEILGVLGPNGAGKTTLIEILEGLRAADSGHVELFGSPIDEKRALKANRGRMGVAVQNTVLPGLLTVEELIRLHAALFPRAVSVEQLIDDLGLGDKRKTRIKNLSGGQQQRVAVALALVGDPDLLFLDEPTSQLDPHARRAVWELLDGQRKRRNAAILLTTHQMEEAQQMCDRVLILDHGRIIAEGHPSRLIEMHCPERIIEMVVGEMASLESFGQLMSVHPERSGGQRIRLRTSEVDRAMAELIRARENGHLEYTDLRVDRQSLEDVFIKLTGRRIQDP